MPIKPRCLAMVLALLLTATTWAQDYPRRPIKVLVPYAPGGATDTVSRIVAPALSEILKQQVVIEEKGSVLDLAPMTCKVKN